MAVTDGRRDTGIGSGKLGRVFRSTPFKIVLTVLIVGLALAVFASIFYMYKDQERKLSELEAERQQLQDRLDELSREKERLEGKLEYTNSLEGLLQYARDNLGYVFPDDTRYDDNGD